MGPPELMDSGTYVYQAGKVKNIKSLLQAKKTTGSDPDI